jgi:hypothetical protein
MRRYLVSLMMLAAALGFARAATAAEVSVAVLGIEPIDVPEPLAQQLTDALRQRASSTAGVHMVQGKDLIEVKMVFGCDGETPACMAQAGKSLGTDKLLYGTIKRATPKTNVTVALKLLDVKTAVVEKFVNDTVPKRELADKNVNASAARWFAALLDVEAKPTLTVTSDPVGANVSVDGTAYGKTPLTLRDLAPGIHNVVVAMAGRQPFSRNVELKTGGTHDLVATLEAEAPPPPVVKNEEPPPPVVAPPPSVIQPAEPPQPIARKQAGHPGRTATILGATALGAALVTGGVLIYTWQSYVKLQDTTQTDLRALVPTTQADANFIHSPNGCDPPATMAGPVAKYKSDCSSGNNFAGATTGLWVATGVLAAGGVAGIVVGQLQAARARREQRSLTGAGLMRQSLRIAPVFTTSGGGLTAKFEF